MKRLGTYQRALLRSAAALLVTWGAMSRAGDAHSCSSNAWCNWHPGAQDACDAGGGGHCEMTDTHECFTGSGPCLS
jgi:hypothetical protein